MTATAQRVVVEELTVDQAREAFSAECQRELGVTGEDFLRAYDGGRFPDEWSPEAICRLEMLLPLAR